MGVLCTLSDFSSVCYFRDFYIFYTKTHDDRERALETQLEAARGRIEKLEKFVESLGINAGTYVLVVIEKQPTHTRNIFRKCKICVKLWVSLTSMVANGSIRDD